MVGTEHAAARPSAMRAAIGTHVEIELVAATGEVEPLALDIVKDQAADLGAGFLGAGTPLGKALVGRTAGSRVPYRMADIREVRLLSVGPAERQPDPEAAAARAAVVKDAVRRSDLEDTVRLALTVDVKWGDYDPEGIVPDEE